MTDNTVWDDLVHHAALVLIEAEGWKETWGQLLAFDQRYLLETADVVLRSLTTAPHVQGECDHGRHFLRVETGETCGADGDF